MLGNVYINKIHARQYLYILSLYCREGVSYPFSFYCCIQRNSSGLISKQLERKDFSMEHLQLIPICYNVNKSILFQLINEPLVFNLIAF